MPGAAWHPAWPLRPGLVFASFTASGPAEQCVVATIHSGTRLIDKKLKWTQRRSTNTVYSNRRCLSVASVMRIEAFGQFKSEAQVSRRAEGQTLRVVALTANALLGPWRHRSMYGGFRCGSLQQRTALLDE